MIQARLNANSRVSASFVTLIEGFQQFDNDLNKLQQFVEVNETAISKILKKVCCDSERTLRSELTITSGTKHQRYIESTM